MEAARDTLIMCFNTLQVLICFLPHLHLLMRPVEGGGEGGGGGALPSPIGALPPSGERGPGDEGEDLCTCLLDTSMRRHATCLLLLAYVLFLSFLPPGTLCVYDAQRKRKRDESWYIYIC